MTCAIGSLVALVLHSRGLIGVKSSPGDISYASTVKTGEVGIVLCSEDTELVNPAYVFFVSRNTLGWVPTEYVHKLLHDLPAPAAPAP